MDYWIIGLMEKNARRGLHPSIHLSINPAKEHMSKTTEITKKKAAKGNSPAPRAEVGAAMFGRDILVEALEREEVEVIFAYPGGASMEIHQSLTKSKIRTILPRHRSEERRV